jgi:hypothetical protein
LQVVGQSLAVLIIVDDPLPRIAARHDVMTGSLVFDPQSSWHALSETQSTERISASARRLFHNDASGATILIPARTP